MNIHGIQNKISYFLKSEMNEIYLTHSIRSFITSMVAVFVPIFLLDKGYSIYNICLYYLVHSIIILLGVRKFVEFAAKRGFKRSIVLSMPLLIMFFISLRYIDFLSAFLTPLGALLLIAVYVTFPVMFYWIGFHLDFAKVHEADKSSQQVSILNAASIFFSVLGPAVGASIIILLGFGALFLIAAILAGLAIVPLFFSKELHETYEVSIKGILKKNERKKHLPYVGEGVHEIAGGIMWPLMLYILAINIQEIGWLYTFSNFLVAIFTIYVGKIAKVGNRHKILRIGTTIHSLSLVVRTFLKTVSSIAATQGIGAISFSLIKTPYASIHYNKSQKQGIAHTIFAREVYLHTGKIIAYVVLLIAYFLSNNLLLSLMTTIIVGAVSSFTMTKISED